MPKEIKILLPDSSADDIFDIRIKNLTTENTIGYRYEIWDLDKDNPQALEAVDFLRHRIDKYSKNWEVAEIFAEENRKIPILLKQKN